MRNLRKLCIIAVLAAVTSAYAGSGSGKIILTISQDAGTNMFFFATASTAGTPACNTNTQWAVSLATAGGRSIRNQVLLAQALERRIV